jgi:hypothetical protein
LIERVHVSDIRDSGHRVQNSSRIPAAFHSARRG